MYEALLFFHFVGLALGVGTGFAMMRLGIATKDLSPEEKGKFFGRASALGKNGSLGLALLILSGVGLVLVRGVSATLAWGGVPFYIKLALVCVMAALTGYMHSLARKLPTADGPVAMATLGKLGRVSLPIGLTIVALAVLAFK